MLEHGRRQPDSEYDPYDLKIYRSSLTIFQRVHDGVLRFLGVAPPNRAVMPGDYFDAIENDPTLPKVTWPVGDRGARVPLMTAQEKVDEVRTLIEGTQPHIEGVLEVMRSGL